MINRAFITKVAIIVLVAIPAFAGGGSIIGNGAGFSENNFQFAYSQIPRLIFDCLQSSNCEATEVEKRLLSRISAVAELNKNNSNRLRFVSAKTNPGFFDVGDSEFHRIAKTGNSPQDPIYVNVDLLYSAQGQPSVDYPIAVSILIHEIGHQIGELNHAELDILGNKIRVLAQQKSRSYTVDVQNERIEVLINNRNFPVMTGEILLNWQGSNSFKSLGTYLKDFSCSGSTASMAGFEISNGHFTDIEVRDQADVFVSFAAWVNLSCFNSLKKIHTTEKKSVKFVFNKNLRIIEFEVNDLTK